MKYEQLRSFYIVMLVALGPMIIAGCAAVAVGGAATTASVASNNRTTGTFIEDEAIEIKSRSRLLKNEELNKQVHINFTSYNTNVLISGEAPTEELRQQVVDIVKGVEKVNHIHNEIIIAAPSSFLSRSGDTVVTTKVKSKMLADKHLNGLNIKVVTENGVVFLMGLVTSDQGDKATEIARTTGGVEKVVKLFEYVETE